MNAFEGPASALWERRIRNAALLVARLALAYLFFSQLFWKLPPDFGCPSDFSLTTGSVDPSGAVSLQRTSGLCDWVGVEIVWSDAPRRLFVTDFVDFLSFDMSLPISWVAWLNGQFLDNVIGPYIQVTGWFLWGAEAFIVLSLGLGLLSRLGGLVALAVSGQLVVGLAGISNPYEWEWAYNLMAVLGLVALAFAPGRFFGLDVKLRPKLMEAAERGNKFAKYALYLT